MTKHVWLVVDADGDTVRDFIWSTRSEATRWLKKWSIGRGPSLHVVKATYEWPKGGKR